MKNHSFVYLKVYKDVSDLNMIDEENVWCIKPQIFAIIED
jgi:hypothetical protein